MASQPPDMEASPERRPLSSRIRFYLLLALGAWILRSLIVAPFSISSGSMLPTMAIGDYLFVTKWPYGYSRYSFPFQIPSFDGRVLARLPERGDIVMFKGPGNAPVDWVKRVIGLPGDTVEVRAGQLVINGKPVPRESQGFIGVRVSPNSPCRVAAGATPQMIEAGGETLCRYPLYTETLAPGVSYQVIDQVDDPRRDEIGPVTVPAGSLFLMGDNRDDSLDSRFSVAEGGLGMVPLDHLVGKATIAFWSTDGSAEYFLPWTWFTALRVERIGQSYRP